LLYYHYGYLLIVTFAVFFHTVDGPTLFCLDHNFANRKPDNLLKDLYCNVIITSFFVSVMGKIIFEQLGLLGPFTSWTWIYIESHQSPWPDLQWSNNDLQCCWIGIWRRMMTSFIVLHIISNFLQSPLLRISICWLLNNYKFIRTTLAAHGTAIHSNSTPPHSAVVLTQYSINFNIPL